jgi:flagellar hook protein FlgE
MSLLTAMSSGTSGLATASAELSVVSDNISNSNTVGFKAGRAAFEDTLAQTVIGGLGQIGLGSRLQAVQQILSQGALSNTGVATDLALQGDGFFMVKGASSSGRVGTYLTRAGQFKVDQAGFLVNLDDLRVQGYGADATGALSSASGDLLVGTASSQARASGTVTVKGNLSADAVPPAVFDPGNPTGTSNFATAVQVYDSLGRSHTLNIYFRSNGPTDPLNPSLGNTWDFHVMADGATLTPASAGPTEVGAGTLSFDAKGQLTGVTQASSFNPAGALPQTLTFNFGDPLPPGTGLAGLTQTAGQSTSTFVGQDGWGAGTLSGFSIDKGGLVQGVFTNGQTRTLGEVGVAMVPAADQLERVGSNLWAETRNSGQPVLGAAGTGGRAFMAAGTLEQSNVDIAEQFVRMIAAQRSFEANSKTITTADQLLSELIAMKR